MRENVFTQLSKVIKSFVSRDINKHQFYNAIIDLIEIADESEKRERDSFKKKVEEWKRLDLPDKLKQEFPYSNYDIGLKEL